MARREKPPDPTQRRNCRKKETRSHWTSKTSHRRFLWQLQQPEREGNRSDEVHSLPSPQFGPQLHGIDIVLGKRSKSFWLRGMRKGVERHGKELLSMWISRRRVLLGVGRLGIVSCCWVWRMIRMLLVLRLKGKVSLLFWERSVLFGR